MKRRKIFIDTDAGTDDAIALMMAFAATDIEIVGISGVGGNVPIERVMQNVLYVRDLCGSVCPVWQGAAKPLRRHLQTSDFIHGKDGLGDIGLPANGRMCNDGEAIQALARLIEECRGELELLTLGPLTNIAQFCERFPDNINQIKHCYVMGGLVNLPGNITPFSEFNIWADPEAADIVLASGMSITMIGWDVTCQAAALRIEEVQALHDIGTEQGRISAAMQNTRIAWAEKNLDEVSVTLADPIATAIMLRPECSIHQVRSAVRVLKGHDDNPRRGFVQLLHRSKRPKVKLVTMADQELFRKMMWEGLASFA